jgi:hypothetical protein
VKWLPKDRLGRLFAAFVTVNAVLIAVLGWQAVESQEVKGSLEGGFEAPVVFTEPADRVVGVGDSLAASTTYRNSGDRTLTLEGAELIGATPNVELESVTVLERGELPDPFPLEGYEIAPGDSAEVWVEVEFTEVGEVAGFDGLRVHYRSGGRSGLSP